MPIPLDQVKALAIQLLNQHGLLSRGWYFTFDLAKRRAGCCDFQNKQIRLSVHFAMLNELNQIKETILHEIAHALVGPRHNHDRLWYDTAIRIGSLGTRYYNTSQDINVLGPVIMPSLPYEAVCKTCGKVHQRGRCLPPGRSVSCGKCSPRIYNPNFILEWKRVR